MLVQELLLAKQYIPDYNLKGVVCPRPGTPSSNLSKILILILALLQMR